MKRLATLTSAILVAASAATLRSDDPVDDPPRPVASAGAPTGHFDRLSAYVDHVRVEQARADALQTQANYARTMATYSFLAQSAYVSKYWIGIQCVPVGDEVRAYVDLEEGVGLTVTAPLPDSPAAKAGLREHDIIIAVNDKPLRSVAELMAAVDAAEGRPFEIQWLRRGQRHTATMTADERPESKSALTYSVRPAPGVARFSYVPAVTQVPDDVEISWTRKGQEPAKLVIRQGDERWEATGDDWSSLPDKVRAWVQAMLPSNARASYLAYPRATTEFPQKYVQPRGYWTYPVPPAGPAPAPAPTSTDRKLDLILKQLDAIDKRLKQND